MPNDLKKWCIEELATLREHVKLLKNGTLKVSIKDGATYIDNTDAQIQHYESNIADLESIINRSSD